MPPPLNAVGAIACVPDAELVRQVEFGVGDNAPVRFVLYDLLRHEQSLAVGVRLQQRSEVQHILDLAQMTYGELVGFLAGRDDDLLGTAVDGEWSLRDLLRHSIAVELRYAAQVEYAATRSDDDPLAIPDGRLPCDRLSPPEPEFATSRTGGLLQVLELLGDARAATGRRLEGIPPTSLSRPSLWGKLEMSVRMRAHQIAAHLTDVVIQSEKMLGIDAPGSEARRIVRRCCAMRGAHEFWSDAGERANLDARYRSIARAVT